MNNYSNMSGLDLFTDPFSRQPQAYNQQPAHSNSTVASRQKTADAKPTQQKPVTAQAQQPNTVAKPTTPIEAPAPQENVKVPVPAQEQKPVVTSPASAEANTQPEPPKNALELDMTTGAGTGSKILDEDDAAKRKAHEEAETKRKAEWEARQDEKRKSEEEALQKLNSMSDEEAIAASVKRIVTDTERLTRRNMKECVAEHIQELCRNDTEFARRTMHPRKSMVHCFKYITRMAKEYVRQEMEDNDIKPDSNGYGCDVPDGLCYQWAEDYFNDLDASEDQVKEEKFVPKPYVGTSSKSASKTKKAATKAKKSEKSTTKDTAKNQEPKDDFEQMSLFCEGGENQ